MRQFMDQAREEYTTIATFFPIGIRLDLAEIPAAALQPALFRCQAT